MKPEQIREQITNSIIETLEQGDVPFWKRGWSDDPNAFGLGTSLSTGKSYAGINQWIVQANSMLRGYQSRWFGTFNQIKFNGGSVKKGSKSIKVVLWKPIKRERVNKNGDKVEDSFMMMRQFSIFSVEDTDLKQFQIGYSQSSQPSFDRFEKADQLFDAIGADIRKGGNKAFYSVTNDYIQMPFESQFQSRENYYSTLAHEHIHFVEKRIGIDRSQIDNSYGFLELVAELGSAFLLSQLGISNQDLGNTSAYIADWLHGMKGDTSFIFKAASTASKAVNYLMSHLDEDRTKELDEEAIPF